MKSVTSPISSKPRLVVSPLSREAHFFRKVNSIISQEFQNTNFNVSTLAAMIFLSPSQLNRRLKKVGGVSAGQLITNMRMQQALYLLTNDIESIGNIADKVGYKNHACFSRAFKKKFGYAPSMHHSFLDFMPKMRQNAK